MTAAPAPTRPLVALDRPLYGATIGQAFVRFWRKYLTFHGRASRSEFWWWFLTYAGVGVILSVISQIVVGTPPTGPTGAIIRHSVETTLAPSIWSLINLVGGITVTVRRLHDTNRRGWWWFLQLLPLIGSIIMIVLVALPTHPAGKRFDR